MASPDCVIHRYMDERGYCATCSCGWRTIGHDLRERREDVVKIHLISTSE